MGVRHYWAKTADLAYRGENQKLAMEISFSILLIILTTYFAMHKELGLFFIGFLVPTIIITLGAMSTIYFRVKDVLESRANRKENEHI